MSTIKEKIEKREKLRKEIEDEFKAKADFLFVKPLLLISENLDDYIKHRIETDKVLEGILEDIRGNLSV